MENIQELDDFDVFYTEQQLREKIYELQQKSVGIVSPTIHTNCSNILNVLQRKIEFINNFIKMIFYLRHLSFNEQDNLEQTQRELSETRHALYDAKSNLENNNQISNELKIQLVSTNAMINRLEDEKMKIYMESIQLKINYETILNERNSLMEQTNAAKSENIETNKKLEIAENKLSALEMLNKNLEDSLTMLKSSTLRMISIAER